MSYLLQEDGVSRIILEDGSGFLLLDDGPPAVNPFVYQVASRGVLFRRVVRILIGCLGLCSFLVIVLA